jgi:hypothetical protein
MKIYQGRPVKFLENPERWDQKLPLAGYIVQHERVEVRFGFDELELNTINPFQEFKKILKRSVLSRMSFLLRQISR